MGISILQKSRLPGYLIGWCEIANALIEHSEAGAICGFRAVNRQPRSFAGRLQGTNVRMAYHRSPNLVFDAKHGAWTRIMTTVSSLRRRISRAGYIGVALLPALHGALWWRASALGGFWGHLNEAGRWFQAVLLISLLVILCCLFGDGWRRWVGAACGIASFALVCIYATGL